MRSKEEFTVPFEGLKLGKHEFNFKITDAFFADMDYSIIEKGNLDVSFFLDKRENMMIGDFIIEGSLSLACDRCNDDLIYDIHMEHQIVFKFDDEPSDDENLIAIASNEFSIHLKPIMYELITVSVPGRIVHKEGECNEEMKRLVEDYTLQQEDPDEDWEEEDDSTDIDPRWEGLNKWNKN